MLGKELARGCCSPEGGVPYQKVTLDEKSTETCRRRQAGPDEHLGETRVLLSINDSSLRSLLAAARQERLGWESVIIGKGALASQHTLRRTVSGQE